MDEKRKRIIEGLPALVEQQLIKQIQDIYEDVTTSASDKRAEREKYTVLYVKKWAKDLSLPEEKIRTIVDIVINRTRWIKEIEELDEEIEEDEQDDAR